MPTGAGPVRVRCSNARCARPPVWWACISGASRSGSSGPSPTAWSRTWPTSTCCPITAGAASASSSSARWWTRDRSATSDGCCTRGTPTRCTRGSGSGRPASVSWSARPRADSGGGEGLREPLGPLGQRVDRLAEALTRLRQPVLDQHGPAVVDGPGHDPLGFELLQALGQQIVRDPGHALPDLPEPGRPEQEHPDDLWVPASPEDLGRVLEVLADGARRLGLAG